MIITHIHRYPFARMVLPLIAGIVLGDFLSFNLDNVCLSGFFFILLVLSALLLVWIYRSLVSYAYRWIFGVSTCLSFFFLGAFLITYQLDKTSSSLPQESTVYRALLTETPQQKERSVLCRARLLQSIDSSCQASMAPCEVLLYLQVDSLSRQLSSGDELLIAARFNRPHNRNNPDEYDYVRHLKRKGISATAYIDNAKWTLINRSDKLNMRMQAECLRDKILHRYRLLGFSGDNLSVLSALTLGYKEELSEEIREAYSVAGASHILAISGMHIGIICTMLLLLTCWVPQRKLGLRIARTSLLIALLWAFAFFVGFTSSAVRSVSMFSLLLIGALFGKKQISLNTLLGVAFLMLLVRPVWLFDVGFQLSFMAVGAILLLQPLSKRVLPKSNRIARFVVGLVWVSFAAQVGVMPLILFYFSRLSLLFLFTNLLIVPLIVLIAYGAMIMLLLSAFMPIQYFVAVMVRWLIEWTNTVVYWIEGVPLSSIDDVSIHTVEVFAIYCFFVVAICFLYKRTGKRLIATLVCLLGFCILRFSLVFSNRPETSVVFYNLQNAPVVHCISADRSSWLISPDKDDEIVAKLSKSMKPYWNRISLKTPALITDGFSSDKLVVVDDFIQYHNKRICVVNNNRWRKMIVETPLPIDYLYICKGYNGCVEELLHLFSPQQIVIDGAVSTYRQNTYEDECSRLNIPFLALSMKGSVRFLI